jgi:hypothetical protein
MTSFRRILAVAALVAASATHAAAGPITTPALVPPSSGSLRCDVVNVADTPASFTAQIIGSTGDNVTEYLNGTTYPSGDPLLAWRTSTDDSARFCRVTLISGRKNNLRVSRQARDSSGHVMAAVEGR